jgi:hypothetical protein
MEKTGEALTGIAGGNFGWERKRPEGRGRD